MISLRRPMLVGSLVALAVTVVGGAAAVVLAQGTHMGETVGTIISSIVAIALAIGGSFIIDRPKLRAGTLVGLAAAAVCWGLLMACFWGRALVPGWDWEYTNHFVTAFFSIFWTALPGAGALLLSALPLFRVAGRVFFYVAGAAMVLFLVQSAIPWGYGAGETWLGSGMGIYGIGSILAVCMIGLEKGDRAWYRWAGVLTGFAAMGAMLAGIWHLTPYDEAAFRWMGVLITLTLVVAHAVVVGRAKLSPGQRLLRWCTLAFGWLTAIAGIGAIIADQIRHMHGTYAESPATEGLLRACGALGIVTAGLTLTLLILWRLNKRKDFAVAVPLPTDLQHLRIECPGCGKRLHAPAGKSACPTCGLKFDLRIEEPRCAVCGYLLYRNNQGRCPECGTPTTLPTAPQASTTPA